MSGNRIYVCATREEAKRGQNQCIGPLPEDRHSQTTARIRQPDRWVDVSGEQVSINV
jgi:hypothetical protein